jgi:hypothetical protein
MADLHEGRMLAAEVDPLDEGVDGGRRGAAGRGHGGVVADSDPDPPTTAGQPFPNACQ